MKNYVGMVQVHRKMMLRMTITHTHTHSRSDVQTHIYTHTFRHMYVCTKMTVKVANHVFAKTYQNDIFCMCIHCHREKTL